MRERGERREKTTNLNEKMRGLRVIEKLGLQLVHKVAYIAIQDV